MENKEIQKLTQIIISARHYFDENMRFPQYMSKIDAMKHANNITNEMEEYIALQVYSAGYRQQKE